VENSENSAAATGRQQLGAMIGPKISISIFLELFFVKNGKNLNFEQKLMQILM